MPIAILCPNCKSRIKLPESSAGRSVECPKCDAEFIVPRAASSVAKNPNRPGRDVERPDNLKTDVVLDEDDEYEEEEERPRKTRRKKRASGIPLWGKAAIAAIFAVVAIGGILYLGGVFSNNASQSRETQTAGDPNPQFGTPPGSNDPAELLPEASDEDLFDPKNRDHGVIVPILDQYAASLPPIVQDEERMKELRAAYMEWHRKNLLDSFDRLYPKEGPGADKAREALKIKYEELALDSLSGFRIPESRSDVALDAAIAAGCTDPVVRYFQFNKQDDRGRLKPGEYLQKMRPIVLDIWNSGYSDYRKVNAVHNLIVGLDRKDPAQREEVRTWEARYWKAFERLCQDPDSITQNGLVNLARFRESDQVHIGRTREQAYDEIAEHLENANAPEYTRLAIKGEFLVDYAWDARGIGLANTVTEMGARLMAERLVEAETVLTAAYKLDPKRQEAPTAMLTVCMGLGYDRGTMEKWFKRSMTANPFNSIACSKKLEYVHPKWFGSTPEWYGFRWQFVKTRNVDGRLPLLTMNSLGDTSLFVPMTPENFRILYPTYGEPTAYHVLHAAISLELRDRPDLKRLRGIHIRIACLAADFRVAKSEMARLNGDFTGGGFRSKAEFEFYAKWIEMQTLPPYQARVD